jgi:gamma-glutamyltranspeptidase/glutathione hydrolase
VPGFRFAYGRAPAVAAEAMVATSQPLATRAGLRMLERGGNAADAALAAGAVLCVTEPMSTGIERASAPAQHPHARAEATGG